MLSLISSLFSFSLSNPLPHSRSLRFSLQNRQADALTLGTHYEYDAKKIKQFYGQINKYYAPGEKTGGETHGIGWGARNFHGGNGRGPPKRAGEQTDYGDYNILVLEHLAAHPAERIDLAKLVLSFPVKPPFLCPCTLHPAPCASILSSG
jgi:hypothetical protein